jgi:hypothetical protein
MAATIAKCHGYDSVRTKSEHRLGSEGARGEANTWRTFSQCNMNREGGGWLKVTRGDRYFLFTFGPETKELTIRVSSNGRVAREAHRA